MQKAEVHYCCHVPERWHAQQPGLWACGAAWLWPPAAQTPHPGLHEPPDPPVNIHTCCSLMLPASPCCTAFKLTYAACLPNQDQYSVFAGMGNLGQREWPARAGMASIWYVPGWRPSGHSWLPVVSGDPECEFEPDIEPVLAELPWPMSDMTFCLSFCHHSTS